MLGDCVFIALVSFTPWHSVHIEMEAGAAGMLISQAADKFIGYVEKPEVKEMYATMKKSADSIDARIVAIAFWTKPENFIALEKSVPAMANNLIKMARLASLLGPAGVDLGVGLDLMVAVGLLEVASVLRLDELSHQINDMKLDVVKGFESLKVHLETAEILNRFLPVLDQMLASVLQYEQILASRAGDVNGFFERLEELAKEYSPSKVIVALRQIHVLITGEGMFQSKPLFKQLAEEANELEGAAFDQFVSALLLQFQVVLGLEMRAVRMLRSFIALQGKDAVYSNDVKTIFEHLAIQRREHDPCLEFEWYLKFMAFGGQMTMSTVKYPQMYVYLTVFDNISWWKGHPGDQGVVSATPHSDGGKFLLSTKKWPDHFMYVTNTPSGKVESCRSDPGPQGHWQFTIKNFQTRTFVLTTCKWPEWHVCMYQDLEPEWTREGDPNLSHLLLLYENQTKKQEAPTLAHSLLQISEYMTKKIDPKLCRYILHDLPSPTF